MSSIRTFLSCNQDVSEKPFTEEDVEWVEGVLGLKNGFDEHQLNVLQSLDDLDVEACPGSGKTTVLVAKLALLARYWNSTTQGICVLSMTNAAREEIQERLGRTNEGQKLLSHPHFIGTIHSFFSEFLAKPYLNSKGMAVVNIDNDFCRSERLKTLQKDKYAPVVDYLVNQQVKKKEVEVSSKGEHTQVHKKARQWLTEYEGKSLEEKRCGISSSWKIIDESYNLVSVNYGREKPIELPDELGTLLKECIKEVTQKGIFDFSDIFVFSKALMNSCTDVFKVLRNRYPLLFIDEAQDTSCSQAEILHELFLSNSVGLDKVTRQRFGDANQTIYTFEPPMPEDGIDSYPSSNTAIDRLTLPVSHRFDTSVSAIASKFETKPLSTPMQGVRKDNTGGRNHCILVFNEDTRNYVIPAFAELLVAELLDLELESANIRVCSHIHKDKEVAISNDDFARTIKDYFTPYIADKMTREYQQHSDLVSYLRHSRYLVRETNSLSAGLEKFSEGVLKSCFIISGDRKEMKGTRFSKIKSVSNKYRAICREIGEERSNVFAKQILQSLIMKHEVNEEKWTELIIIVVDVINYLLDRNDIDSSVAFLEWKKDGYMSEISDLDVGERTNVYKHKFASDRNSIELKLGTIHSVKGQTHTATLLLESTNRGPIFGQLKPYILGSKAASKANRAEKDWLNTLYVGLTRPSHLICLAIPESHKKTGKTSISWTTDEFEILKSNGWRVARVKENLELDFI